MSTTNDNYEVADFDKSTTKECLNCFEKHLGEAIVLMNEISDRFIGKLDSSQTHIKQDISDAMKELNAAENHVNTVESEDKEHISTLKQFGSEARSIRGALRDLREVYPVLNDKERRSAVNNLQKHARELDTQIRDEIEKNGCGDCQNIDPEYKEELRQKVMSIINDREPPQNVTKQVSTMSLTDDIKKIMPRVGDDFTDFKQKSGIELPKLPFLKLPPPPEFGDEIKSLTMRLNKELKPLDPLIDGLNESMMASDFNGLTKEIGKQIGTIPKTIINDFFAALFGTNPKRGK